MKISKQTIDVLNNFASINPSIVVKSGVAALSTISPQKNILATAQVVEKFDSGFAIYDLKQFLSAISLFDDPDFTFEDKYVTISHGRRNVKYFYADPSMITVPPDKEYTQPKTEVEFEITAAQLAEILKAASILQAPEIAVRSDGKNKTKVVATTVKNSTSNEFDVEVDHTSDVPFQMVFKSENLKMMPGDYKVAISSKGLGQFVSDKLQARYFIATETSSKYGSAK